jgi:tetratricopeptide (TPR) repeat protein
LTPGRLYVDEVSPSHARASSRSDGSNKRSSPGASQPNALAPCRTQSLSVTSAIRCQEDRCLKPTDSAAFTSCNGAIAYHKQALPLFEQAGAEALLLTQLHWLGDAYRDRGDYDDGERLLEETATRARELGFYQQLTSMLHSLGDLSLDRGDPETALARFADALEYAVTTASRRVQIYCIAGIACALLQQGDDRTAARLWGIAEDQERRLGFRMILNERQRYERLMSNARERLGGAYETERRVGAGLTLEEAVAEARRHVRA